MLLKDLALSSLQRLLATHTLKRAADDANGTVVESNSGNSEHKMQLQSMSVLT